MRTVRVTAGLLAVALAVGCDKGGGPTKGTGGGSARSSGPAPAAAGQRDYRQMSKADLESLLKQKAGFDEVALTPKGQNQFAGTARGPDGTQLPIAVTVTADKITYEIRSPAGSLDGEITEAGHKQGQLRIK